MNGSRSNTPTLGGKPSLDQLNRTIEGLEARIQGLMGDRQRATGPRGSDVDAILERQRNIGSPRDRVSSVMERPRPDAYRPEPRQPEPQHFAPQPEPGWDRPAPRVAAPDPALAEIAATLGALRQELRQGLTQAMDAGAHPGLYDSLGDIRNEMRSLKTAAATAPMEGIESLRTDLAYLAASIDKLEHANHGLDISPLRIEFDEIRDMLGRVAREDSVRGLEARVAGTERAVAGFDPDALREELVQLAWHIDGIKSGLGDINAGPAIRALEEKLLTVASAVEALGRNIQSQPGVAEHFSSLDHRLDEITRAIAASARQGGSAFDSSTLQRLETRLEELVDHVAAMPHTDPTAELNGRFELLGSRIEELANEEAARRLEDRIAQLSNVIERNYRESTPPGVFAEHLEDISRKIDGLGGAPASDLIARLDMLSRKMDELEIPQATHAPAPADTVAMTRLESRLADIAARLDETAAAPAADNSALHSLERQIANLSTLLNQSPPAATTTVTFPDGFGDRLMAIEDYMAASDEFIVEAARQAAETVVEAYARNGVAAQGGASAAELTALAGLADDLRTLEAHTRSSEERTQATFEALHETLVQIAGRLNDLGNTAPAKTPERSTAAVTTEPVRETTERLRESVAMPKAAQPEFADLDLLAGDRPAPRRAPENSKVAILDEADLMPAVELPAEAVIETVPTATAAPKPSKSLLAGLAERLKPSKKVKPADEGKRLSVDPAPALDPGAAVVAPEQNLLLEPGTGVPDVKKILERVRNGQQPGGRDKPSTGTSDVIAAARRAAQAAAAETGAQKLAQPSAFKKEKDKKPAKTAGGGQSSARRPILLAAAAILLVVMSYPLVSNLIGSRSTDNPAPEAVQERAVTLPAEDTNATANTTGDDASATTDSAPIDDAKPATAEQPNDESSQTTTDSVPEAKTAADTIMVPAENTAEATMFEKPATTDTAAADPIPALPATETAKAEDTTADQTAAATEQSAAEADPTVAALPEGLQPASLVEAAKKGDPLALFEIGARYTDGRGFKIDLAEAAKWYQRSAERGLAPAEYRLANFYEKGTGVTRDVEKAITLYKSAADKGNASAMHNLAVLYATGVGGKSDFSEAARWFQQAAELNVRDSQFNLAILYARGNGVPQDLEETYKWFAVAAREGDQDAAQKRDEVANALSAEQLKSAKAKLDLWKPQAIDDTANTPLVPDEWLAKGQTTATVDMKRAIRNIQAILNMNGFDAGKADGDMGKKTVAAIKAFQKSVGQEPTGRIDDALVKELLKKNKPKG